MSCFQLFPVVYVLIDGSPEDSYSGVLNEVVAICPETRQAAQFIITDYDLAMMNAANSAWPNASVTGCFFHFAQVCNFQFCISFLLVLKDSK